MGLKNETAVEEMILVDESDNEIGTMEKLAVHQQGLLHRAFSLFIFNSKDELLLQKRAQSKYHSPGLWSNSCCSHPRPGETTKNAVKRRMFEEIGIECEVEFAFSFTYKVEFENGLSEHELDHVYFGTCDSEPKLDPLEASDWKFISLDDLLKVISVSPDHFSVWLKVCLPEVMEFMKSKGR